MKQNLFRRFLRGSWHKIVCLCFLGGATSLCGVYLALIAKKVVDGVTGQSTENLLSCGITLGVLIFLQLVFQILLTSLSVRTVASMRFRIQSRVFEGYLHKQKLQVDRFHSGELVNRICGDASIVADGVINMIPSLVSVCARIIFGFCALLMLDSVLAILCVIAGLLMLVVAQIYRKKSKPIYQQSRVCEGRIRSFVQESAQNLAVIKAFSVYNIIERHLGKAQDEAFDLAIRRNRLSISMNVCFYVAMTAGYYLALGWGAWRIFTGAMSFGTLTAILGLTGDITTPFRNLAGLFPQYVSVSTSVERLDELEKIPDDPTYVSEMPEGLYDSLTEIKLKNIGFSYGDAPVLQDVSAAFPKNTLTAITGESGAGKSTLLSLLAGISQPDTGEIVLDTSNGAVTLGGKHRGLFAYVPQDFLLLSGNVLENITLFAEEPDMERFWQAVKMAELDEVIQSLPEGIETFLGEGGSRLSGGQRQRMALARALYSRAEVLLLDEATSALSKDLEEKVLTRLRNSGRTVIFVTHRHTAAGLCDRTLVVEYGRLTNIE